MYCIVLYLYIYIALLAVHTNQKRVQCERPREKRTVLRERKEALGSPVNKVDPVEGKSWFQSEGPLDLALRRNCSVISTDNLSFTQDVWFTPKRSDVVKLFRSSRDMPKADQQVRVTCILHQCIKRVNRVVKLPQREHQSSSYRKMVNY